jgi:protein O-mannosyl-transferase
MATASFRRAALIIPALIFLVSVAVYSNSLFNLSTADDELVYQTNGFLGSLRNLPALLDHRYFAYSGEASYRPVCTFSYFVDRAIWSTGTVGPRITHLLLFACTAVLLYRFFLVLSGDKLAAALGAALFAVHPVHSEVVDNLSFREDVLVGLFIPLSWLLFTRARGARSPAWIAAALLAAAAALFSKEGAIVLPFLALVLLWMEWMKSRNSQDLEPGLPHPGSATLRAAIPYLTGLALVTLFFMLVRFHWMQFPGEASQPRLGGSLIGTLIADVKIQARYIVLLFDPFSLRAYYPPESYSPTVDGVFFLSLGVLFLVVALALFFHRNRWLIGSLLWWFISLAPVSNIHPIFNPIAERYLYLASILPSLAAGVAAARALRSRGRVVALTAVSAILLLFGLKAHMRGYDWRSELSLWGQLAGEYPTDPTVLGNLARAQYAAGDSGSAFTNSVVALAAVQRGIGNANPTFIYVCLGCCWMSSGEPDKALTAFRAAEARLPARSDIDYAVYRNIGIILDERDDLLGALGYYEKAAAMDPYQPDLWRKLAVCQLRLGDAAKAAASWSKARSLSPNLPAFEEVQRLLK